MLDPSVSKPLASRLYRYFLPGALLHAISAALYQGDQLLIKTRPVHCYMMTGQGLQLHLQAMLDALSQNSGIALQTFHEVNDLILDKHSCPVRDCHLNPASRLEELL